jgi:hypothetical protein
VPGTLLRKPLLKTKKTLDCFCREWIYFAGSSLAADRSAEGFSGMDVQDQGFKVRFRAFEYTFSHFAFYAAVF